MTIRNTYAAEAWDKVYDAFQQINFTSYDYDTVKESLLQYLKIYHAEHFNDFIESSELVAVLELFAYVAELLAYRVDMVSHENFITTAQRKQSILRLARLISYRASRNIPARGLVKLTSVRTTEAVIDSLGNNLANVQVTWNDANNSNWKEQFFLVMNKLMTTKFGQPQKAFQVGDVAMQLYSLRNDTNSLRNGVFPYSASVGNDSVAMELVPADLDQNGPVERDPDSLGAFNIIYASDGRGDGSDYTGFLAFTKQGTLVKTDYSITEPIENRRLEFELINVNNTDVWVYRVDDNANILEKWKRVETLDEQNLYFNDSDDTRKKYEVETLEGDRIALLFGDGNFSDIPFGSFEIWTRTSVNENIVIPRTAIVNQNASFVYVAPNGTSYSAVFSYSLTSALQNNSASETIERIRQSAPTTYYAQNRMVNGQDYNTYMLKDPSILKLKTINRTFAGQPKYIEWNDASGAYQNIKLFGDDLRIFYHIGVDNVSTAVAGRAVIDSFIEPLLEKNGMFNMLTHISATDADSYGVISYPRRRFIEDNVPLYYDGLTGTAVNPYGDLVITSDATLNEKTAIQAALDSHWYGEALNFVNIGGVRHGVIPDPVIYPEDDSRIYDADLKRTIDGVNTFPPGDIGSGLQSIQRQKVFGLRYNRFLKAFGNGTIILDNSPETVGGSPPAGLDQYKDRIEVFTLEVQADKTTVTVISNIRGRLTDYTINPVNTQAGEALTYADYYGVNAPINFTITNGTTAFEAGDAFIIDVSWSGLSEKLVNASWLSVGQWEARVRKFGPLAAPYVNLSGWWQLISANALDNIGIGESGPNKQQSLEFDATDPAKSWLIIVSREDDENDNPKRWNIFFRDVKMICESPTTKFWFNQDAQIIDYETKKPLFDKIRILRSNLDSEVRPLRSNDVYDVVGFVYDDNGTIITSQLEIMPTRVVSTILGGDGNSEKLLQFENFTFNSYEFFAIDSAGNITFLPCGKYYYIGGYDMDPYDTTSYDLGQLIVSWPEAGIVGAFEFTPGNFLSNEVSGIKIGRRRAMPRPDDPNVPNSCNIDTGLDFMWQHFTPDRNLVDPSVTNIHDAFVLTRGYYESMQDYVTGLSNIEPAPPTPLELRNSYGYLLDNKMLSDTVVLHSGKVKLLFGALAAPQLRAKFRVVMAQSASMAEEKVKIEIVSVIRTFFDVENWDFGSTFYATELLSLIHQRLSTQIASVVLVPTYSINSFGSLFTIESGFDEILQSCATVDDVEIVSALTPTVLRQLR